MKAINFELRINFSGKIANDDEIKEVMNNIVNALERKVQMDGIAPENSDLFTQTVQLYEPFSGIIIEKTL